MMTAAQEQTVKRNLLAAQISYKRSELNEESLYVELHNFFQHLKETVLHELREYWVDDDTILLEGQLDLILSPIFESQQEYYNILRKHNIKEYNFGCKEASRLVKLARKQVSSYKSESNTIKVNKLANLHVDKDELFGTNEWTQQKLLNQSFTASESTMNRVDQDINKIISDGYKSGDGVNKVAANIETRFEQLKTWESKRIARTEMHNAHQMGIMNTYQEMGVQYTQWSAAHDSRTRDSHKEIDGEIIPLGGTYSNGCQYPGDTKGPIKEWINCRCGNVPFIIPDGYIAPPGMSQFREEDLIQTLDYWNQDELIATATQESNSQLYSENYGVPLDHSLSKAKFAVPIEDLSEFGITDKGLEVIQGFQKKRFGSTKEYGLAFDEKTGKILTKEYRGVENDVIITPPKGKYSTIHYHTEDGFNPLSHGDIEDFLKKKHERVGINVSKKETWLIKQEHKFHPQEINKITKDIKRFEDNQLKKMSNDFKKRTRKIKNINDPKKRKTAQMEFDDYLNNEFIDKHNKELGDNILNYSKNVNGLKIKRVMNTPIAKRNVKNLPTVNVDKKTYFKYVDNKKYSTNINSDNEIKFTSKDEKRLKELKIKEKNNSFDSIFEEGELIELEKKKKLFEDSLKVNKESSKFTFTREDKLKYDELQILKQEGKLKGWENRNALRLLENQKELDSLHQKLIKKGKLSSKDAERYKKLYNNVKIKKKFKLVLLEDTLKLEGKTKVKPNDTKYIGDLNNPKNIKEFKGTTKDGMLPGNESIDRYFTKNVSTTGKHDEIIEEWVYDKAYQDVQLFDECDRDIKKLRNNLIKSNPSWTSEMIDEAIEEVVSRSNKFDKLIKGAKTKKNMKFYRRQQELNISEDDIKKGETILPSARSVSISKEGATDYVGKAKSYKWELEIEAPVGTNAVYIAPKAKSKKHGNKFIRQMETILDRDTPCDILEIIDDDVKNIHKVRLRVKV